MTKLFALIGAALVLAAPAYASGKPAGVANISFLIE